MANRDLFTILGVTAIGVISAPQAGKTTLLERTLPVLKRDFKLAVLESDLQPSVDAERIRSAGSPVWQIVRGGGSVVDAGVVPEALRQFPMRGVDLLIIERVLDAGAHDLPDWGEHLKVLVHRIASGEKVPPKTLALLAKADAVLLNTVDCPQHVTLCNDLRASILALNPKVSIFQISSAIDQDLMDWAEWLRRRIRAFRAHPAATSA